MLWLVVSEKVAKRKCIEKVILLARSLLVKKSEKGLTKKLLPDIIRGLLGLSS
jgi:hypothetical protein